MTILNYIYIALFSIAIIIVLSTGIYIQTKLESYFFDNTNKKDTLKN
jgi:FtsZ-interacting cell division protein ZipA